MTTAWDLLITTRDAVGAGPVDQDDLSLALAGAELLDMAAAGIVALEDDRVLPLTPAAPATTSAGDSLLDQAVHWLVREPPYEKVEEWLWRRGERLTAAYLGALETEGYAVRPRRHWVRSDQPVLVDSPAREHAAERWASGEPVLSALGSAVGIGGGISGGGTSGNGTDFGFDGDRAAGDTLTGLDDATAGVLAAVSNSVTELEAVRQRRRVEQAAFDNIWRGM